ncbi:hypothetical protein HHX47_DHR3001191 [Lentinula edodes]|nr:hypothetical protein HHX47_DHR3001191 [Lentinula edodes]
MLFLNRIFRSPSSSLSPTLYYPLHFLSLFTLALLINSVITFAEAAPVPPGISQQSEQFEAPKKIDLLPSGFEKCTPSATSGFLFRVGFYESTRKKTTRSGHGVLVLCIGKNNCFGYTTTTTAGGGGTSAAGTQHSNGLVIHTTTQRRTDTSAIRSDRYQLLPNITPNCDKFNTWSEKNYEKTLVDFLMSIVDLQNALTKLDATVTVTIDSQVSYILGVLGYLHSKGMIIAYDKPQIKKFLEQPQSLKPLSVPSTLSWGFRGYKKKTNSNSNMNTDAKTRRSREGWMFLKDMNLPLHEKTSSLLCFGIDHCFGLRSDDMTVRDINPTSKRDKGHHYLDRRYHFVLGSATLYPSFNLQRFEGHLGTSTTSFFARLIGHSQHPAQFADIRSEEIKKETGLEKRDGENMDTFYFRVLLGYMAAKEIIGNYNTKTYDEIMKALELAKAGKTNAAVAEEEPGDDVSSSLPSGGGSTQPVHDSLGTNSQGGGATNLPPRISVLSMLNARVNTLPNH